MDEKKQQHMEYNLKDTHKITVFLDGQHMTCFI